MGYDDDHELPPYRVVGPFPVQLDAMSGSNLVTGQSVQLANIDEPMREVLGMAVPFAQPIAQIAEILDNARQSGEDFVRLTPPGAGELVSLLNYRILEDDRRKYGAIIDQHGATRRIDRIYWTASTSALVSILDRVRTMVVQLVSEVRLEAASNGEVDTAALVARATDVVINGNRNKVVVNVLDHGSKAATSIRGNASVDSAPADSSAKRFSYWLISFPGAIVAIGIIVAWLHHWWHL